MALTDSAGEACFELAPGDYQFKVTYEEKDYWSPMVTPPDSAMVDIYTEAATIPLLTGTGKIALLVSCVAVGMAVLRRARCMPRNALR